MISLSEASKRIGVTPSCICTAPRYKPFLQNRTNGKHNAMFDIDGYFEFQDNKDCLISKVQLFIEYLRHIENIGYEDIARKSGVTSQQIRTLTFGFGSAMKIAKTYENQCYMDRFDKYYGWK